MKFSDKQILMIIGAGGLLLWYLKNKTVEVVGDVAEAINPVNPDNIFNEGVNSVGSAISGDDDWSLGGWIYDITHDEEF